MFYCSHCGSPNTKEETTGNGGTIFVSEDLDGCEEAYDPYIIIIECKDCDKTTYPSVGDYEEHVKKINKSLGM